MVGEEMMIEGEVAEVKRKVEKKGEVKYLWLVL